ncbi:MAG: hypothetical protein F4X08_13850 [Gemmatimonadetes bacterium]|nr:hypothetical protein [Gemmatimonadota bacterium]
MRERGERWRSKAVANWCPIWRQRRVDQAAGLARPSRSEGNPGGPGRPGNPGGPGGPGGPLNARPA